MIRLSIRPLSPIWKHRAFWRFWVGETISMTGSSLSMFALPLVAVVALHVTPGQMGFIRALGSAPAIVLGLLAGAWVDRASPVLALAVVSVRSLTAVALRVAVAYASERSSR